MSRRGPAYQRLATIVAAIVGLVLLGGCLGPTASEQRAVGSFSSISASNGIEVHVTVGAGPSLTVTAAQSVLKRVSTTVEGDRLTISLSGSQHSVKVEVATPTLTGIDASSSASIVAEGVAGDEMRIGVSSQATVTASGSTNRLTLNASSQSTAKLADLAATSAVAHLSSQARAAVRASDSVTGDVTSQARLTVYGSPGRVDVATSSEGEVERS